MKCYYLHGENIKPHTSSEAQSLVGCKVCFLREQDIDKSGRGYFFPRHGTIAAVKGRNIAIDHQDNFTMVLGDIREMSMDEQP